MSALIAWVRDDYGSGKLSRNVFKDAIPAHQLEMHRQTQALVKDQVGTYADLKAGVGIFGLKELSAQWIEKSTALQAGEALFASIRLERLSIILRSGFCVPLARRYP